MIGWATLKTKSSKHLWLYYISNTASHLTGTISEHSGKGSLKVMNINRMFVNDEQLFLKHYLYVIQGMFSTEMFSWKRSSTF